MHRGLIRSFSLLLETVPLLLRVHTLSGRAAIGGESPPVMICEPMQQTRGQGKKLTTSYLPHFGAAAVVPLEPVPVAEPVPVVVLVLAAVEGFGHQLPAT